MELTFAHLLCMEYSRDDQSHRSYHSSWSNSCRGRVDSQLLLSSLSAEISAIYSDDIPHIELHRSTWNSAAFDRWRLCAVRWCHNFSWKYHWVFDSSPLKRFSHKYTLKYRLLVQWGRLTVEEWCTEMKIIFSKYWRISRKKENLTYDEDYWEIFSLHTTTSNYWSQLIANTSKQESISAELIVRRCKEWNILILVYQSPST